MASINTTPLKRCSKCGDYKSPVEFNRRASTSDGLQMYCRTCARSYAQKWNRDNPERFAENQKQFHERRPEYTRQQWQRWYARNRDQRKIYKRHYNKEHADEIRVKERVRYERKRAEGIPQARYRSWRKKNPDKVKARDVRRRAREVAAPGDTTSDQLMARIAFYGNRCAYCGGPFEQVDHVIPVSRGGSHWPSNLRPSCTACNQSKKDRLLSEWEPPTSALILEAS